MKLSLYLRDKIGSCIIGISVILLVTLICSAFDVQKQATILIIATGVIGTITAQVLDYIRRKQFYDKLLDNLERLDPKYLISEMTDRPGFCEGDILCDVLKESGRSMYERVADYRRECSDFREYIELWVHEIKVPVYAIQLMCHNDGNTRYATQLGRVDHYIENVLYFARCGSAEKDYIIRSVSLRKIFGETAVRYRDELLTRNISLKAKLPESGVMTDSKWLSFILGQLMANSIKYAAPGRDSEIEVYAEQAEDRTVLHFRDNGIGIPESDISRVFDKSFTGENGRLFSKSTGMGLYLVKKLCNKLGHTVTVQSVHGEYTEICIIFGNNSLYDIT